jgi:hypothetical protein
MNIMKKPKKELLEINGTVIKDSLPDNTNKQFIRFTKGADIASFFETNDAMHASIIETTFEKILKDWDLLEYIHEAISRQIINDFTEGQIACMFEVLTEECLELSDAAGLELQAHILKYALTEGQFIYNLGSLEEFASLINSMHPIIFTILVSKIRKHYDEYYDTELQKQIIIGLSSFTHSHYAKLIQA